MTSEWWNPGNPGKKSQEATWFLHIPGKPIYSVPVFLGKLWLVLGVKVDGNSQQLVLQVFTVIQYNPLFAEKNTWTSKHTKPFSIPFNISTKTSEEPDPFFWLLLCQKMHQVSLDFSYKPFLCLLPLNLWLKTSQGFQQKLRKTTKMILQETCW